MLSGVGGGKLAVNPKMERIIAVTAPLLLLVLAIITFMPGQYNMPPLNRNEARFAQASKQMIETGNYIDIRFNDRVRYQKPIGTYWLQVLAVFVSGKGSDAPIWVYRSVSFIAAIIAVLLTYCIGLVLFNAYCGIIAGLFMISLFIVGIEAHSAKADAPLLACVLLMQLGLAMVISGHVKDTRQNLSRNAIINNYLQFMAPFIFWLGIAFGILIKGPIGPIIGILTAVCFIIFTRDAAWLKQLRPIAGILLCLLIVLPWFVAIGVITEGAFYSASVGNDFANKLTNYYELLISPPGTYTFFFLIVAWPLAPFVVISLKWIYDNKQSRSVIFCLCWFIPMWIMFELSPTKRPHYVMPLYPALAMLTGAAILSGRLMVSKWWHNAAAFFILFFPLLLTLVLPFASIFLENHILWLPVGFMLLVCVVAFAAWRLFVANKFVMAMITTIITGIMFQIASFYIILPRLSSLWLAPRLAATMNKNVVAANNCSSVKVLSAINNEAHIIFAIASDIKFGSPEQAARFLGDWPSDDNTGNINCNVVFVERSQEPRFRAEADKLDIHPRLAGRETGYNLAKLGGGRLDVSVYTNIQPEGSLINANESINRR